MRQEAFIAGYILKRIIFGVATIIVVATLTFFIMNLVPGIGAFGRSGDTGGLFCRRSVGSCGGVYTREDFGFCDCSVFYGGHCDSQFFVFYTFDVFSFNKMEAAMRKIRGREVSIIFQDPMTSLNPVYTIGDQIGEAIRLHTEKRGSEITERVKELLTMVGINKPEKRIRQYPHELSGGMRQRVVIAMRWRVSRSC